MKVIGFILTPIFGIIFYLLLGIFHPIQWIALKVFGYSGHKKSVDFLNLLLMRSTLVLGNSVKFTNKQDIPTGQTVIFVSNHQSMFDIPPLIWHLRKYHAKFVAKKELGKGIPSISFNLRHGGAALIDRKDREKALETLTNFAKTIKEKKWSTIIFPEGTRSKGPTPKAFSPAGLETIIVNNPDALVVPISIQGSWKMFRFGNFPLGVFGKTKIETLKPLYANSMNYQDLFDYLEKTITQSVLAKA
jgi:1-acyl-sn-glycerol-3-phosphate acyltransferase